MEYRACEDTELNENEIYLIQFCPIVQDKQSERINPQHIFGTFEQQVLFIKQFKLISRKWKLILELKDKTI